MLKKFKLKRISSTENGTFGVLLEGSVPFALTLEPPWKDNQPFVSCIPANAYICFAINSRKFGDAYRLNDVPGRFDILFHKGNFGKDTQGCILVGEQYGMDGDGNPIITSSRAGFNEFMRRANGEEIDLVISESTGHEGMGIPELDAPDKLEPKIKENAIT